MNYRPEHLLFLRENYQIMNRNNLVVAFNNHFSLQLTKDQIVSTLKNHKITSGRNGHFPKGNKGWNVNTKGLTSRNKTSFKKGNKPKNLRPLGFERICPKDGFISIKISVENPYTRAKTRFKHKHVVIWEKEFGPVPKGMIVKFIDGNKLNCVPENLTCVSRSELLYLNRHRYHELPGEVKPSFLTLAKLETTIHKIKRGVSHNVY
jgi:hypothetical protein